MLPVIYQFWVSFLTSVPIAWVLAMSPYHLQLLSLSTQVVVPQLKPAVCIVNMALGCVHTLHLHILEIQLQRYFKIKCAGILQNFSISIFIPLNNNTFESNDHYFFCYTPMLPITDWSNYLPLMKWNVPKWRKWIFVKMVDMVTFPTNRSMMKNCKCVSHL